MSDKILVLKQSGVTQFQAIGSGERPRMRDMFRTAMGRGADTSKLGRAGAGLGLLARLGAIASTAQQTGSRMQGGNTFQPLGQISYTFDATDPTQQMQEAGLIPSNQAMAPPVQPVEQIPLPEFKTVPLPTPSPPMMAQQTGGQAGTPMPPGVANQIPPAQPAAQPAAPAAPTPQGPSFLDMNALQEQPQQPQPIPVSSTPPQPQPQPQQSNVQSTLQVGPNPAKGPQNLAPAPSPPMQALNPQPAGPPPPSLPFGPQNMPFGPQNQQPQQEGLTDAQLQLEQMRREMNKANVFALNAMHILGDEIFLKSPEKVGFACAHLYLKSR